MSSTPPPPPPSSEPGEPREPREDVSAEPAPQGAPSYEAPREPQPPQYGAPAPQPPAENGPAAEAPPGNHPQYAAPGGQQYGGPGGGAPYGAPAGQAAPGAATPLGESEEKTWAILAHLSAPVAALISAGLLNFVGPLVIWAIFKDRSPKVRHASAGAFNFNLTLWIAYALLIVLSVVSLGLLLIVTLPIGLVIWVVSMVLHVLAAVKASNGEVYTYPAQIPVLK